MPNINLCMLAGHTCRDIELRYTANGKAVGEFGLAVNRVWKNEAGEKQEEVSFFDCVAFGKTAETMAEFFGKGSACMVEGRLKMESWEDKQDGRKRTKIKVIVEKFHFCGETKKPGEAPGNDRAPARRAPAATTTAGAPPADDGDDVPF